MGYDVMGILVELFDVGRLRKPARGHGLLHVRTARELGDGDCQSMGRGNDDKA